MRQASVEQQLTRVLASPQFASSDRLQRFLRYVIEQSATGNESELKEYSIGVEVYGRGAEFDPRYDSIVRTEANRLRNRLRDYYENAGASDPILIELPRGRYVPLITWRAPTEPTPSPASDVAAVQSAQPGPEESITPSNRTRWLRRPVVVFSTLTTALIAAVAATSLLTRDSRHSRPTERTRQWVLIADFDNRTGDSTLDDAVESALEVELSHQSSRIDVVPPARIDDVLRLMRLPVDTRLSRTLAREVALRDSHIPALITGSLARIGDKYSVDVTIVDSQSDKIVAAERQIATRSGLLSALGQASRSIRSHLGETVDRLEPPRRLDPETTQSLRAIQLFTTANTMMQRWQWSAAEPLLRDAIAADPQFASGHMYLAWVLFNLQRPQAEWLEELERAEFLTDKTTERERLFILGSGHSMRNNRPAAIAAYEALTSLYPNDFWALNNLANLATNLEPGRGSLHLVRFAELMPQNFSANMRTAWALALEGKLDVSRTYAQRARAAAAPADAVFVLDVLAANDAWITGDAGRARSVMVNIVQTSSSAHLRWYFEAVGIPALALGMVDVAEKAIQEGAPPRYRARWMAVAALTRKDRTALKLQAKDLVDYNPNPLDALILIRAGDLRSARRMLQAADSVKIFLATPTQLKGLWQVVEGEVALAEGQKARATALFDSAISNLQDSMFLEYFVAADRLAELLSETGDVARARTVLRTAVNRRANAFLQGLYFWTLCATRLAALERLAGNDDRALALDIEVAALRGFPLPSQTERQIRPESSAANR